MTLSQQKRMILGKGLIFFWKGLFSQSQSFSAGLCAIFSELFLAKRLLTKFQFMLPTVYNFFTDLFFISADKYCIWHNIRCFLSCYGLDLCAVDCHLRHDAITLLGYSKVTYGPNCSPPKTVWFQHNQEYRRQDASQSQVSFGLYFLSKLP